MVDLLVGEADDRDHVLDQRISSPDLGREIPFLLDGRIRRDLGLDHGPIAELVPKRAPQGCRQQ
ncbi:hypothetical protein [Bradyrhizobium sp. 6(2017)]|uniref:hypothetical protein n=1 Tax=Bradyrhizobium sp. 6(2017) TaxID=1197460 RepID=UPI0013E10A04|nr:hypothetical protein [Bradyrhizobium sp. 6(2017)]QIG92073.1 hypothetical protein G6P99_05860 [Bradyrhizobium sp. 6(2017)]